MEKNKKEPIHESYETASGPIPYNMTNDYMFRVILQKNESVLRGLIGALLHLDQRDIISVEITNPIMPGEQINNKTFVLDINVLLNNNICLNLEMQVINPSNWQDRSLSYLCRMFDNLQRGEDYEETNRAIHIGILDFTLFEEVPEFYACYKLLNVKNHHVFNENFVLNVLDLNQIDLATEEDRFYEIDRWAQMFKAGTWEELRMIAEKNKYMSEAAAAMYELNADEIVRQQCMAREEYNRHEKMMQKKLAKKDQELAAANEKLEQERRNATEQIEQLQAEIARLQGLLDQKQS
ncbi:MAG: Rpn family recombination-promoting nuclease/putative transposase [bacterium]|nr:Rpn family recombination-promoting nuclease/putative transposase [bacterium]MDY4099902.1 Rpn family recombination-promoting nuclease/putative transposase [Lachnospiraceae bacterium]